MQDAAVQTTTPQTLSLSSEIPAVCQSLTEICTRKQSISEMIIERRTSKDVSIQCNFTVKRKDKDAPGRVFCHSAETMTVGTAEDAIIVVGKRDKDQDDDIKPEEDEETSIGQEEEIVIKAAPENETTENGTANDTDDTTLAAASLLSFSRGDSGEESASPLPENKMASPSPTPETQASANKDAIMVDVSSQPPSREPTPDTPAITFTPISRVFTAPARHSSKFLGVTTRDSASRSPSPTPTPNASPMTTPSSTPKAKPGRPRGKGTGTTRKPEIKFVRAACLACHKAHMKCRDRDHPDGCLECRQERPGKACVPRPDGRKMRGKNKRKTEDMLETGGESMSEYRSTEKSVSEILGRRMKKRGRRPKKVVIIPQETPKRDVSVTDAAMEERSPTAEDTTIFEPERNDNNATVTNPDCQIDTFPIPAERTSISSCPPPSKRRRIGSTSGSMTLNPCTTETYSRRRPTVNLPSLTEVFGHREAAPDSSLGKNTTEASLESQLETLRETAALLQEILRIKAESERTEKKKCGGCSCSCEHMKEN